MKNNNAPRWKMSKNTMPRPIVPEPQKTRWKILPMMWRALRRTATVLGFLMILNAVLMLTFLPALFSKSIKPLPHDIVLFLSLKDGLREIAEPEGFFDIFAPPQPTVRELVDALDKAATDKRVKGLVARMEGGSFDLAQSFELRAALKRFRHAGKFAYIYADSYGEGGGGLGRYALASAFDQIWMQPLGVVSITGVSAEIPFMRETLDKIGVSPQFFQRKEYKSAYESLTNKEISPANKEEMSAIVADMRAEILKTVPQERKMSAQTFESLVHKGLLTAQEAKAAGLLTHVDYPDVLLDNIAQKVMGVRDVDKLDLVDMEEYSAAMQNAQREGHKKVALVYAVGAIMPSAEDGGMDGGHIAAADEIAPVLHDLAKDESVSAVVLRIDSPGGSPSASESILRGVEKLRAAKKPVIVSMGGMAASGGYWIAAYGDRIFAAPTTLTGSIGVVGGKMAIGDLSEKLGVHWEKISWGENAGLWSMNTKFSASEAERMNAMMDQVYDNFIARVAKGRKMKPADVDKIAGGRVWTGRRALEVGLVDDIGGLSDALDYTAKRLGQKSRADLDVVIEPKPQTPLEHIVELVSGEKVAMGFAPELRARLSPVLRLLNIQENPALYGVYEPLRVR